MDESLTISRFTAMSSADPQIEVKERSPIKGRSYGSDLIGLPEMKKLTLGVDPQTCRLVSNYRAKWLSQK